MKLRLREDPREWRKFALVLAVVAGLVGVLVWRQGWWGDLGLRLWLVGVAVGLTVGAVRPRLMRPIYRGAMTGSFHVGQVMGRVLLVVLFFGLVTPLGWFLRLLGKDLLQLRLDRDRQSYWEPARRETPLDRLF